MLVVAWNPSEALPQEASSLKPLPFFEKPLNWHWCEILMPGSMRSPLASGSEPMQSLVMNDVPTFLRSSARAAAGTTYPFLVGVISAAVTRIVVLHWPTCSPKWRTTVLGSVVCMAKADVTTRHVPKMVAVKKLVCRILNPFAKR